MTDEHGYFAAEAAFNDEDARLRLIEEGTDETTIRCLTRLGVGPGWHCLEVGAGAGSIAMWLAQQVGPDGDVVATDLDTRHLRWITAPNVSVREHDVVTDALEREAYDLAHSRAVLEHVSDPDRALSQMVASLRRGGWLVVEGADFSRFASLDKEHPLASTFDTAMEKLVGFIARAKIFDPFLGPTLPGRLEAVGLVDVGSEDVGQSLTGASPAALMLAMSWRRFDATLTQDGVLGEQEAAGRDAALRDPTFTFEFGGVAAWGRRP
jgi:SAM-dependent methyltransferase